MCVDATFLSLACHLEKFLKELRKILDIPPTSPRKVPDSHFLFLEDTLKNQNDHSRVILVN